MDKLASYRNEMAKINKGLLFLIKKRILLSKKIGAYKKKNKLPVQDKAQEKRVFANLKKESNKLGLDEKSVEKIFEEIITYSRKVQK